METNNLLPFYVGEIIKCIDVNNQIYPILQKNKCYTVRGFSSINNETGVLLEEIRLNPPFSNGQERSFKISRFKRNQKFPIIKLTKVLEEISISEN